jgi:hypothetical protein
MSPSNRECALRREFAVYYPGIEPSVWEIAANVAERVLTRRKWSGEHAAPARPLKDEHFDFRGGRRQPRGEVRTRLGDRSQAP